MFSLSSSLFCRLKLIKVKGFHARFLHKVKHNENRQIFYVKLDNNERAVLLYNRDKNIMDVRSINVPITHQGQGLARLLAEAAFTFAILRNFLLILTCSYMQKIFLATKTLDLEERVIGPPSLLEAASSEDSVEPIDVDDLPDPQDPTNGSKKNDF